MDNQRQQPEGFDKLWEEGFIRFYAEDIRTRTQFKKEQLDELWGHLSAPVVREYLKEVGHFAMRDFVRIDFTRPDDQLKLAAKHGYLKGVLSLIENIIESTKQQGDRNAQSE